MKDDASKKTILVVDDEKPIRDLLEKLNTLLGYSTLEAEDGESGLALFEREHPQLVISDIYMPKMNGLQLLRSIRRIDPSAPVILITGYSHYKQLIGDQQSRPDGYFEKPFKVLDLAARIKALLEASDST